MEPQPPLPAPPIRKQPAPLTPDLLRHPAAESLGADLLMPQFLRPLGADSLSVADLELFFPEGVPGYEAPQASGYDLPFFPPEAQVEPTAAKESRLFEEGLSLEEVIAEKARKTPAPAKRERGTAEREEVIAPQAAAEPEAAPVDHEEAEPETAVVEQEETELEIAAVEREETEPETGPVEPEEAEPETAAVDRRVADYLSQSQRASSDTAAVRSDRFSESWPERQTDAQPAVDADPTASSTDAEAIASSSDSEPAIPEIAPDWSSLHASSTATEPETPDGFPDWSGLHPNLGTPAYELEPVEPEPASEVVVPEPSPETVERPDEPEVTSALADAEHVPVLEDEPTAPEYLSEEQAPAPEPLHETDLLTAPNPPAEPEGQAAPEAPAEAEYETFELPGEVDAIAQSSPVSELLREVDEEFPREVPLAPSTDAAEAFQADVPVETPDDFRLLLEPAEEDVAPEPALLEAQSVTEALEPAIETALPTVAEAPVEPATIEEPAQDEYPASDLSDDETGTTEPAAEVEPTELPGDEEFFETSEASALEFDPGLRATAAPLEADPQLDAVVFEPEQTDEIASTVTKAVTPLPNTGTGEEPAAQFVPEARAAELADSAAEAQPEALSNTPAVAETPAEPTTAERMAEEPVQDELQSAATELPSAEEPLSDLELHTAPEPLGETVELEPLIEEIEVESPPALEPSSGEAEEAEPSLQPVTFPEVHTNPAAEALTADIPEDLAEPGSALAAAAPIPLGAARTSSDEVVVADEAQQTPVVSAGAVERRALPKLIFAPRTVPAEQSAEKPVETAPDDDEQVPDFPAADIPEAARAEALSEPELETPDTETDGEPLGLTTPLGLDGTPLGLEETPSPTAAYVLPELAFAASAIPLGSAEGEPLGAAPLIEPAQPLDASGTQADDDDGASVDSSASGAGTSAFAPLPLIYAQQPPPADDSEEADTASEVSFEAPAQQPDDSTEEEEEATDEDVPVVEGAPAALNPAALAPLLFAAAHVPGAEAQSTDAPASWSSIEELVGGASSAATGSSGSGGSEGGTNTISGYMGDLIEVVEATGVLPALPGLAAAPTTGSADEEAKTEAMEAHVDSADLEVLAREVYGLLRQRIEIERERQGFYSGRSPW